MIIILWIVICSLLARAKRLYPDAAFEYHYLRLMSLKFGMVISLAGFVVAAFLTYKFGTKWFYVAYSILFVAPRLYMHNTYARDALLRASHSILIFYSIYLWIALIVMKVWFQW